MANFGERSQVCRNLGNDDGPPPTHLQVENENSGVLGVDDPRQTQRYCLCIVSKLLSPEKEILEKHFCKHLHRLIKTKNLIIPPMATDLTLVLLT